MNNFKDNWKDFVYRNTMFLTYLVLGMIIMFFIGSSLLCKINYSAGVLKGMSVTQLKTIPCNADIVDYTGITNYSHGKLSFWMCQNEVHIEAWDGGTCWEPPQSWHKGVSTIDSITLYDFQYPDKARIDSNKAASKAETEEFYRTNKE